MSPVPPEEDRRERQHFWSIVFNALSILGVFFAAYQIHQSATLQRESAAIDRRNQMANLLLDTHKSAHEFLTVILASPVVASPTKDEHGELVGDDKAVTESIRTSGLLLDAAVARAQLVDDPELKACLFALGALSGVMMEAVIPNGKDFSAENFAVALDGFPPLIKRYWDGLPPPESLAAKPEEKLDMSDCPFQKELEDELY